MSLNKPLDSIDENDLQDLIDHEVPEGKTIEYKKSLPGNKDKDKKEFLSDVSSFANAIGSKLLCPILTKQLCLFKHSLCSLLLLIYQTDSHTL
jgi:hypothetical protein